jgi:hypothetical protein
MSEELTRQTIIDEEHLRLLSLGYMISAAISAFFSLIGLMYVFMGVMMSALFAHAPEVATKTGQEPPAFIGWIFAGIGLGFFLFMIALAAAKFRVVFCINHRRSRAFCMVVAGISCLGVPYGTILGVFSFMVLGRDSIARQFDSGAASRLRNGVN